MDIDKKLNDGVMTLAVSGRLDTNTSPELEAEVKTDGIKEVIFDFAGLEYISSAGLRVLMGAQKAMMANGGKVKILIGGKGYGKKGKTDCRQRFPDRRGRQEDLWLIYRASWKGGLYRDLSAGSSDGG